MSTNMIYDLTIVISDITGFVLCYYFYNGFLKQKPHRKIFLFFFYLSIITFLIITNLIIKQPVAFVLVSIVAYSVMVLVCFEGHFLIRTISGLFYVTFGSITEVFTVVMLSLIFKTKIIGDVDEISFYVLGMFVSKLIMLMLIRFFLIFIKKKDNSISIKYLGLMITIPGVSIYITIHYLYQYMNVSSNTISTFIAIVGILYINLIVFGLFDGIVKKVEENNRYRFANQQLILQQEHYKSIMDGHQIVRGLWHDMKNNLISVYSHIEKQEYKSAKENVESIQSELQDAMKGIITGNTVIDAILASKIRDTKDCGINIKNNIIVQDHIPIHSMDLCMILGNALDNAIEACERIKDKEIEKHIEVMMRQENGSLFLSITNPVDIKTLKIKNGKFISSKTRAIRQEHGYGLYNIERAVKKNSGNVKTYIDEDKFYLDVIVPIDKNS